MALNQYSNRIINATLLLAVFVALLFNPFPASALGNGEAALPNFTDFSKTVQNGQADTLRGVYVPDVLALPVVQQPTGNAGYVSNNDGEITQFNMASQFGNVGLLAHNHLSGDSFSKLTVGQEIRLVYGDGKVGYFVVTEILRYQALQPTSPFSSFRNLNGNDTLTAEQMFNKVYRGDHHVTFQTCIAGDGTLSWGRLFVMAVPKSQHSNGGRTTTGQ